MKKNFFCPLGLLTLTVLFLGAESAPVAVTVSKQMDSKSASTAASSKRTDSSIRNQVKQARRARYAQMPYLDRGYIRSTIRPEKIQEKIEFVQSPGKKDLRELQDRAIEVHTPARAARERIALARRRILVALRSLFPDLEYQVQERVGSLSASAFNAFNYKFILKQPVFRGGILWNTLLQEKAGLEAAEKEYRAVIQNLIRDLSAAYFEYQRALQVLRDQEHMIDNVRRFVEISQQKYEEQLISEMEHLNTQSLFSQMEYDFENSKQEVELAELELEKYLDIETEDHLPIVEVYNVETLLREGGKQNYGKTEISPLANLVDLAYRNRPELQVESAKLQSARIEERVKWGEMIPHADITLEMGKLGEAFDIVTTDPGIRKEFRLLLEVNWNMAGNKTNYTFENDERAPSVTQFQAGSGTQTTRNTFSAGLLNGLQDLAEAKEAEVARLDQVIELEKAEKEAVHDVKQAYFDYQKSQIQVRSSLQSVDYRKRLSQLAQLRLEKNEIQISEYLQAQMDLLRELVSLHKALSDEYTARAKLNHAVGIRDYLSLDKSAALTRQEATQ